MITLRRGFSMIGLLVTMVCIVILFVIGMNAMNRAITGEGSARPGTVRSTQDMISLSSIYQGMYVAGQDLSPAPARGRGTFLPYPSIMAGSDDRSLDTTANLYSALIAGSYVSAQSLVAANEFNPFVQPALDYRYGVYQPEIGQHWDPNFQADLDSHSNVSFAHMPLYGERFRTGWQSDRNSRSVILGNRGPENGIDDPESWTYGRSGEWGGHIVLADGHIQFTHEFTLPGVRLRDGRPDNIFATEEGPEGSDAIIAFTREMRRDGPVLQFD